MLYLYRPFILNSNALRHSIKTHDFVEKLRPLRPYLLLPLPGMESGGQEEARRLGWTGKKYVKLYKILIASVRLVDMRGGIMQMHSVNNT